MTAAGTAAGLGFGASLALSLFIGTWGGLGFGFMTGATVNLSLHGDDPSARRVLDQLRVATTHGDDG